MKLFPIASALIFILIVSSASRADDLDDARRAWENNDFKTAEKLLEPLAAKGDAEAQFHLCVLYMKGDGVEQDFSHAADLCQKSAEQGNADAQSFFGWMYRNGVGKKKNATEALKWFSRSAEKNNVYSLVTLGAMYATGEGTKKDLVQAYKWTIVAKTIEGDDGRDAIEFSRDVDDLAAKMTPADVAAAKKLASDWLAGHPPPVEYKVSPKLFFAVFFLPAFFLASLPGKQARFHFYYRLFTWMAICSILLAPLFIWLSHTSHVSFPDPTFGKSMIWTAAISLALFYTSKRCSSDEMTYLEGLMWAMSCVSGSWGGTRVVLGIPLLVLVIIASLALSVFNDVIGRSALTAAQYSRLIGRIYRNRMVQ
jgi:hypothetical protein